MRVLLDTECAAIAGGNESQCVQNTTNAGIATGAIIGGLAGAAAGGVGALPGAVAGAGVGSLVAQVAAPPLCAWANSQQSDESNNEESNVEEGTASGNPFRSESVPNSGVGGNSTIDSGAPLQLVVDTSGSDY